MPTNPRPRSLHAAWIRRGLAASRLHARVYPETWVLHAWSCLCVFFLVRIQQTRARIQYHTCVPCLHARPDRVQQMAVSRVRTQQPDGGIHIFLYPNTPAPPGCSTHAGRMFSRILRARNHATRLPAQEEKEAPPGCCHREAETHEVCCRIRWSANGCRTHGGCHAASCCAWHVKLLKTPRSLEAQIQLSR
jgi:hypothetical protein